MEKVAGGGTKKEDDKREFPEDVLSRPQTDDDEDHDFDFNYRWGMDDPVVLTGAERDGILEEENKERTEEAEDEDFHGSDSEEEEFHGFESEEIEDDGEEAFHGFNNEEVKEVLELQAIFRENNGTNAERLIEVDLEQNSDITPERRQNLSLRERKKRKAAARAR